MANFTDKKIGKSCSIIDKLLRIRIVIIVIFSRPY